MLRVSKMADYATLVMVYLARHRDSVSNAKVISTGTGVATPTVSKLLKLLAKADLLQSQRGATGGYSLARDAEQISVAEIIFAVEGRSGMTDCSYKEGECHLQSICQIEANWQVISKAVEAALDSVTLAVLAKPKMTVSKVDVSQIKKIMQSEDGVSHDE